MLYVILCLLIVVLLWAAWYLDRTKLRYEEWVAQKVPLPKRMRFITDEDMKEIIGEATLNKTIRELRSILMALLLGTAFMIIIFLGIELSEYIFRANN